MPAPAPSPMGYGGPAAAPAPMPAPAPNPMGYGGSSPSQMAYGPSASYGGAGPAGYGNPSPYGPMVMTNMEVSKTVHLNPDYGSGNQYGGSNPQGYYYPQPQQSSSNIPYIEAQSHSKSSSPSQSPLNYYPYDQASTPIAQYHPNPLPHQQDQQAKSSKDHH
ncbi:hypothetical protein QR98_0058670 [Sarcoptes scabiei]|nr:hypothetical protein QR98_0058670 [Sarcoptes scabiei]